MLTLLICGVELMVSSCISSVRIPLGDQHTHTHTNTHYTHTHTHTVILHCTHNDVHIQTHTLHTDAHILHTFVQETQHTPIPPSVFDVPSHYWPINSLLMNHWIGRVFTGIRNLSFSDIIRNWVIDCLKMNTSKVLGVFCIMVQKSCTACI